MMKRAIVYIGMMMWGLTASAQVTDFNQGWTFWSDRQPTHKAVTLPHDAMQTEQRSDSVADGRHNGFFPGGMYHYEKTIDVPAKWLQKHVTLQFEGVYQKSHVFVNEQEAGGMVYGYTPFEVCLDGRLHEGQNTIRVDVDNTLTPNSRWYTGAGIYRPVHLSVQEQTYIEDVKISTQSISPASINVSATVGGSFKGYDIRVSTYWQGQKVAEANSSLFTFHSSLPIAIPNAHLWSADMPNLYQARVELLKDGRVIETQTRDFGIREIRWSTKGQFVNGQETKLRGGCLHHDNGILGACEYDEAAERRIRTLKEYGFNAIRSAHNPCSEAVLRACDKLGMYVMDELWDMWYRGKTTYDYSHHVMDCYEQDVRAMVRKDFSHPSVIMYSIGNEVNEPSEQRGLDFAQTVTDLLHRLDPTRPVTAGINLTLMYLYKQGINWGAFSSQGSQPEMSSEQYNEMVASMGDRLMRGVMKPEVDSVSTPVFSILDIAGYNYGNYRYELDATAHPERIVLGTETYPHSLADNWRKVEQLPYLIGDFMWTAWDYIGEVGLGAWYYSDETPQQTKHYPWLLAGAGALDRLGHPTGEALLAKAIWQKDDKPYITPVRDKIRTMTVALCPQYNIPE